MGEIKSTLDLVMERTRHLTMSPEEKDDLHRKEIAGKAKGWIQKCVDGQLSAERLASEMDQLDDKSRQDLKHAMKRELLEHLRPEGDSSKIFELIGQFTDLDPERLKEMIGAFQGVVSKGREEVLRRMTRELGQKGISGTAVVPNLNLDADWSVWYQKQLSEAKRRLQALGGTF